MGVIIRACLLFWGDFVLFWYLNNETLFTACMAINETRVNDKCNFLIWRKTKSMEELKEEGKSPKYVAYCGLFHAFGVFGFHYYADVALSAITIPGSTGDRFYRCSNILLVYTIVSKNSCASICKLLLVLVFGIAHALLLLTIALSWLGPAKLNLFEDSSEPEERHRSADKSSPSAPRSTEDPKLKPALWEWLSKNDNHIAGTVSWIIV